MNSTNHFVSYLDKSRMESRNVELPPPIPEAAPPHISDTETAGVRLGRTVGIGRRHLIARVRSSAGMHTSGDNDCCCCFHLFLGTKYCLGDHTTNNTTRKQNRGGQALGCKQ